jgi:aminoglycoside phosphotransferase (APT) family kinase protein
MDVDHPVRSYACDAVGDCSPDRITAVSRFESGDRHAVYKVSYLDSAGATNHLVVRVATVDEARDCAQAEREATVLKKAHGVAAPHLYDFRCESPWFAAPTMCMQFVPGRQRDLIAAASSDVERLGSVVGWVHGLPTDDLVEWFPHAGSIAAYRDERVEQIMGNVPWVRDPLPVPVQRRLQRAVLLVDRGLERARSSGSFATDERLVLLHGDPGPGNILWGPEPVLIDWEYARLGDPADEVAYIFSQHGLSAPQRKAFWHGYRSSTDPQQRLEDVVDRVSWWEPVTLLGSALWWVERWSRRADADAAGGVDPSAPKAPGYYLDHVIRRLDRFDELFNEEPGAKVL